VDNLASANVDVSVVPPFFDQALGVASILLQTAILMGVVLLLVWRWAPPFGALALIFTLVTILISFMHDQYSRILLALVAGLIADLLLSLLKPSADRPVALRIFAFAVPTILYGLYFVGMIVDGGGIRWSVHLWAGSAVMAGIVGVLLSYLVVPPQP
jgi:hypothetical protein